MFSIIIISCICLYYVFCIQSERFESGKNIVLTNDYKMYIGSINYNLLLKH